VNPFPMMTQIVPTTAPSSLHTSKTDLRVGAGEAANQQHPMPNHVTYGRSSTPFCTSGPEHGSLKKLFRFNEMQAPPQPYERY
jgi:hypothetical protein